MADCMEWTPTGLPRSLKRRADGTMAFQSPYTPYHKQSMPGAWPQTPDAPPSFLQPQPFSKTQQPQPVTQNYYLQQAKRLCSSLRACFSYTTTSMSTIVRSVRQRQVQRRRTVARSTTRTSTANTQGVQARMGKPKVQAAPKSQPQPKKLPLLEIPYKDMEHLFGSPNSPIGIKLQDDLNNGLHSKPNTATVDLTDKSNTVKPDARADVSDISDTVPEEWWPYGLKNLTLEEAKPPQPSKDYSLTVTSPSEPAELPVEPAPEPLELLEPLRSRKLHPLPVSPEDTATAAPKTPPKTPPELLDFFLTPKSSPHSAEQERRTTRKFTREIQREKESQQYKISALSKEWNGRLIDALKLGHGNYKASDFVRVVPRAGSMGTDAWLNDEVINGYLKLICDHGNKDNRPGQVPRYHAFSSFFMNNLIDPNKGPASVKRWAARAKVGGKNLLQVDQLFVPINAGAHWTLLVVSPKHKRIVYYNSMSGSGAKYIQSVVKWLKEELGSSFEEGDWILEATGQSPQQNNMSDCGVFAITSARQLMLGHNVMDYGPDDIPTQRRRIVAELVNGGLIKSV